MLWSADRLCMLIVFESIANLKIDALPEYFGQQCAVVPPDFFLQKPYRKLSTELIKLRCKILPRRRNTGLSNFHVLNVLERYRGRYRMASWCTIWDMGIDYRTLPVTLDLRAYHGQHIVEGSLTCAAHARLRTSVPNQNWLRQNWLSQCPRKPQHERKVGIV